MKDFSNAKFPHGIKRVNINLLAYYDIQTDRWTDRNSGTGVQISVASTFIQLYLVFRVQSPAPTLAILVENRCCLLIFSNM